MIAKQLDAALRSFCRRRPFRPFLFEFTSGAQLLVVHPEMIRNEELFYVWRAVDGGYGAFAAESVSRLLDTPITSTN